METITRSRFFTSEEDLAFSNLRSMMNNSRRWREFLNYVGIYAKDYDENLWTYNKIDQTFTYNGLVVVSNISGPYRDILTIKKL